MKLTDLNPRWIREFSPGGAAQRHGQGLSFRCPHCVKDKGPVCYCGGSDQYEGETCMGCDGTGHRVEVIRVYFANPVDGGLPVSDVPTWDRIGDTFETMTLSPSIDASKSHPGGWHGFLRAGVIEGA